MSETCSARTIPAVQDVMRRNGRVLAVFGGQQHFQIRVIRVSFNIVDQGQGDQALAQVAAGRNVNEIIAAKPTAEFDARWAQPGTMPADTLVALIDRNLRARARN